jgi:hypothetical protein
VGEIRVESPTRAAGYFTSRSESDPQLNARTAGVYLRAEAADADVLDHGDEHQRSDLISRRLADWKSIANS